MPQISLKSWCAKSLCCTSVVSGLLGEIQQLLDRPWHRFPAIYGRMRRKLAAKCWGAESNFLGWYWAGAWALTCLQSKLISFPFSLAGEWWDIGLAHPTAHGWVWQQLCVALSWCCPAQLMWEAGMELMGVRGKKMSPLFALMGSKLLFELTGGCEWHPTETCECVYWCESGWCFVQEWWTALERDQK